MHDSLEIEKKDNGYSVDVMSQHDDEYDLEELVFQDELDVLAEVLRWLGYDEDDILAVIGLLDEDAAYEITDKGHTMLEQVERERVALARLGYKRQEQSWEADYRRLLREEDERRDRDAQQALKRGSRRGSGYWTDTPTQGNSWSVLNV